MSLIITNRRPARVVPRIEALEDRTVPTAGTLDASFGVGGYLLLDPLAFGNERAESVAVQSDGRIVIAGFAQDGTLQAAPNKIRVTRLHSNGTPDTTFDQDGSLLLDIVVTVDIFQLIDDTVGLVLQPDGKILVGSTTPRGGTDFDFVIARLNGSDGSLDATFGTGGVQRISFDQPGGGSDERFRAMTLDAQGRIVVAGLAFAEGPFNVSADIAVARLNGQNGSLDATFGDGGRRVVSFDEGADEGVTGVAIQDEKIIVAGYDRGGSGDSSFALIRLTGAGNLDPTFGNGGRQTVEFAFPVRDAQAQGLAVQPWDNKIVLAGGGGIGGEGYDFWIARLEANGSLDLTFAGDGTQNILFSGDYTNDRLLALTLQQDHKILVGGYHQLVRQAPSEFGFAVARLHEMGTLDTEFGTGGRVSFTFPFPEARGAGVDDKVYGMAVQPDGRIVLVGHFSDTVAGGLQMAVARLLAEAPQPPPRFNPPPPGLLSRGVAGTLVRKGKKGKQRLFLRLAFADTGELIWERACPVQAPAYRSIALTPADLNGDGVVEMAFLTAIKGKQKYQQPLVP